MKKLFLSATLLLFSFTLAPAAEPGFELRVRAAEDFIKHFEYLGTIVGQAEQAKQFADVVKVFGGDKGVIEGVDLKRSLGAYIAFTPGIVDSQIVVMLPVANEKAFLNLLTTRLSLNPEKRDDGSYFMQAPGVGPALYFRMHKDYACFTIQEPKNIDADKLLDPKTFFTEKDSALIGLKLHIERIPEELRKQFLGQFELKINESTAEQKKNGNAVQRLLLWAAVDGGMRGMKSLINEGKTLTIQFFVEPKTDDLTLVTSLTARDGTDLQKTLNNLPAKPALASKAAEAKDIVASFGLRAALPDAMKKDLAKHVDEAFNEALKNANGDEKTYIEKLLNSIDSTVKSGDYEFGVAVTGTPNDGKLRAVVALKATDGKDLEKLIKEIAQFLPANEGTIEFDAMSLEGGNLHKLIITNAEYKKNFGTDKIWAKLGNDLYVVGFEPDGDHAKRIAMMKPGKADMLTARIAWTKLQSLVDKATDPAIINEVSKDVFGNNVASGSDETTLNVTGGEQLTFTLNVKGKVIQYLAAIDKKKKGQ